jgi:hypothetical protein
LYGIPNKLIFYTVIIHGQHHYLLGRRFQTYFFGEISGCLQRDKQFVHSVSVWRIYTTLLLDDPIYLNIDDELAIRLVFGSVARWR